MSKLKLNQLNKQKLNEREMNLIEGGAMVRQSYTTWLGVEIYCGTCTDGPGGWSHDTKAGNMAEF